MSAAFPARKLAGNRTLVWLVCVLGGGTIHLALWQISEPSELFSDFYKAYYPAAEYLWEKGLSATWPLTDGAASGFVNIPIVAWLFVPLVPLGEDMNRMGIPGHRRGRRTDGMVAAGRLGRRGKKRGAAAVSRARQWADDQQPARGQHHASSCCCWCWRSCSGVRAGISRGPRARVCAVIKLPLLLFGAYYCLRGKWRVVLGGATSITAAVLLSFADYGVEGNLGWYRDAVAPFLGGVIPAFNVQSIDGFLMRLWTGEAHLYEWDPLQPGTLHKVVRNLLLGLVYGSAVWFGWRANRAEPMPAVNGTLSARDTLEFVLVINIAILTSPISWTHYYLLLLVVWGLYLGDRLPVPDDRQTRWLMWSSLLLTSLPVIMPQHSPSLFSEVLARTVISSWFFGGLLLLAVLMRALWRLAPSGSQQTQRAGSHAS
jgi:hypothetical protein